MSLTQKSSKVKLIAVTMRRGNFYSPSNLIPPKLIDEAEFLELADHSEGINVDGQQTTVYSGYRHRWIVAGEDS